MSKIKHHRSDYFIDTINNEVQSLLRLSKKILDKNDELLESVKESDESKCLTKFSEILSVGGSKYSIEYFEDLFNKYKKGILLTHQTDAWLTKMGEVIIQFGDTRKNKVELSEEEKLYRFCVSSIYRKSLQNSEITNSKLQESLDNIDEDDIGGEEIMTYNFLLKLMRIFYCIIDTRDSPKIEKIVQYFENKLEVPEDKRLAPVTNNSGPDIVSELAKIASEVAKENDINLPIGDTNMINTNSILTFVKNLQNNPLSKTLIKTGIQSFKDTDKEKLKGFTDQMKTPTGEINFEGIKNIATDVFESFKSGDPSKLSGIAEEAGLKVPENFKDITNGLPTNFKDIDMNSLLKGLIEK